MSSYGGLCPDCQQIECDEACMKATSNVKLSAVYVVCKSGPEWNEIVAIYLDEQEAITARNRHEVRRQSSKDVFDTLSAYTVETHPLSGRRANVEHHTAAQAAEIEALRSDLTDYMRIANTEATRAERLEEAVFRKALGWRERTRLDKSAAQVLREKTYEQCADELDELLAALLHPTAGQQGDTE